MMLPHSDSLWKSHTHPIWVPTRDKCFKNEPNKRNDKHHSNRKKQRLLLESFLLPTQCLCNQSRCCWWFAVTVNTAEKANKYNSQNRDQKIILCKIPPLTAHHKIWHQIILIKKAKLCMANKVRCASSSRQPCNKGLNFRQQDCQKTFLHVSYMSTVSNG